MPMAAAKAALLSLSGKPMPVRAARPSAVTNWELLLAAACWGAAGVDGAAAGAGVEATAEGAAATGAAAGAGAATTGFCC